MHPFDEVQHMIQGTNALPQPGYFAVKCFYTQTHSNLICLLTCIIINVDGK